MCLTQRLPFLHEQFRSLENFRSFWQCCAQFRGIARASVFQRDIYGALGQHTVIASFPASLENTNNNDNKKIENNRQKY